VLEKDGGISWTDRVRNEGIKEERDILRAIKKRGRLTGLVTSCLGTSFYDTLLK